MKTTKRAKKNLARQKLKLESEIANIEVVKENKTLDDYRNIRSEIIKSIIILVLIMFMILDPFKIAPFADNGGPYVKAEEAFEDKGNAVLENHFVEGSKINNDSQPSNDDYQKALSFNKNLLDYFIFVDEERNKIHASNLEKTDSTPSIENKDVKEITHLLVVPAAGFETKENIFVDIVNYESDKQPSKDEIVENIKKESAFLLASENTEEGKLRNFFSEGENQIKTINESEAPPLFIFIMDNSISIYLLFFIIFALFVYHDHKTDKKRRLIYIEDDEPQSKVAPAILKINNNKDLTRYSNKL